MKKAFTLAEILIVLVIIGVLTMILLPIAFQSSPDEQVMKFKKANNTLSTAIKELVSSDEYYSNGNLAIKTNGEYVDNGAYFCNTLVQVLDTKSHKCADFEDKGKAQYGYETIFDIVAWEDNNMDAFTIIDEVCLKAQNKVGEEIVTIDDAVFYEAGPGTHYGIKHSDYFQGSDNEDSLHRKGDYYLAGDFVDSNGFNKIYKTFCIDIDGINKGEDPFGYGIRADGKIYYGARATEWMNKEIQKND